MFSVDVSRKLAIMFRVCIYKGYGMYDKDGTILHRVLSKYVCAEKYTVSFITPEEICAGKLIQFIPSS